MDYLLISIGSICGITIVWIHKLSHLALLGEDQKASDTEYHLLLTDLIRKNKCNPFKLSDERFVINSYFNYPYLLHWLLSFFKKDLIEFNQHKIQIVLKLLVTLSISLTTGYLSLKTFNNCSVIQLILIPFSAALLFGFSPMNRCTYWWAQYDFQLSPRALGMLLIVLLQFLLTLYIYTDSLIFYLLSIVNTCLVCLSSRFALQCTFFTLIGLSIFQNSFSFILILPIALLTTTLVTFGDYYSIFRIHLRHFYVYAKRTSKEHPDARLFNPLSSNSISMILNFLRGGYYTEFFSHIQRDVILRPVAFFPFHITTVLLISLNFVFIKSDLVLSTLALLWFISWASCILTSFKYTKFLGEGDRYVEFGGIFPSTALCLLLSFININNLLVTTISLLIFSGWYHFLTLYQKPVHFHTDEAEKDVLDFLNNLSHQDPVVACVPLYKSRPIASDLNIKVFSYLSQLKLKEYDKVIYSYPILRLEKELLLEYSVTHLLVYKWMLPHNYIDEHISDLRVAYENKAAIIYEVFE